MNCDVALLSVEVLSLEIDCNELSEDSLGVSPSAYSLQAFAY